MVSLRYVSPIVGFVATGRIGTFCGRKMKTSDVPPPKYDLEDAGGSSPQAGSSLSQTGKVETIQK
jgi:hypothetical protein